MSEEQKVGKKRGRPTREVAAAKAKTASPKKRRVQPGRSKKQESTTVVVVVKKKPSTPLATQTAGKRGRPKKEANGAAVKPKSPSKSTSPARKTRVPAKKPRKV